MHDRVDWATIGERRVEVLGCSPGVGVDADAHLGVGVEPGIRHDVGDPLPGVGVGPWADGVREVGHYHVRARGCCLPHQVRLVAGREQQAPSYHNRHSIADSSNLSPLSEQYPFDGAW